MTITQQAVGLLGGSFDPVHKGHISIAESFLNSGYISKLWILLTPDPPHKTKQVLCDFEYRFKMLEKAFEDFDNVEIKDIEKKLPKPSYTIRTLKHLSDKYPDHKFYLCMGEDSVADFKNWKDWKEILNYCDLLVARRPVDDAIELDPAVAEKTHFIDHEPIAISSTDIRERIEEGKDISALVPEQVENIICRAELYQ